MAQEWVLEKLETEAATKTKTEWNANYGDATLYTIRVFLFGPFSWAENGLWALRSFAVFDPYTLF